MTLPLSEEDRHIVSAFVQLINRRKSCISCLHFDESVEGCGLYANQRPPARTIALGCARWLDEPPF